MGPYYGPLPPLKEVCARALYRVYKGYTGGFPFKGPYEGTMYLPSETSALRFGSD